MKTLPKMISLLLLAATGIISCTKNSPAPDYTYKIGGTRIWHGTMITGGTFPWQQVRTTVTDTFAIMVINNTMIYVNDSIIGGNYYRTKLYDTLIYMSPGFYPAPNTNSFNGDFDTHQGGSFAGVTITYNYGGDSITLTGTWPSGNNGDEINVTLLSH